LPGTNALSYIAQVSMTNKKSFITSTPVDHSIDVPFEVAKTIFMLKPREGARFDLRLQRVRSLTIVYDNDFTSIIDRYFYETFSIPNL
jgi:hypothetical protein